jgi:hypothetical protein
MPNKGDAAAEAATLILEARIGVEAAVLILKGVMAGELPVAFADEIEEALKLTNQAGDALEALQKTFVGATAEGNG